jgi:hypothetical protein
VTVPIKAKPVQTESFRKPPETVVEKIQERVEAPPVRPSVIVDECPAPAATPVTLPVSVPVSKPKPKLRKLVKKTLAPAPVLVGGQPQ